MGCDIHMYIEYKIGDAPWQADSHHVYTDEDKDGNGIDLQDVDAARRNYEFFGALAGVRCDGPNAKGLPSDVSEIIQKESDRWDCDGHSHSYSSLEEFKQALKVCDLFKVKGVEPIAFYNYTTTFGYSYASILAYCKKQVKKFKFELETEKHLLGQDINTDVECRLVYWFDN
jgi:hypothetical protein